jgi:hypothetical protein
MYNALYHLWYVIYLMNTESETHFQFLKQTAVEMCFYRVLRQASVCRNWWSSWRDERLFIWIKSYCSCNGFLNPLLTHIQLIAYGKLTDARQKRHIIVNIILELQQHVLICIFFLGGGFRCFTSAFRSPYFAAQYLIKIDLQKLGLQIKKNKIRTGKVDYGKIKIKLIFISPYFKN